MGGVLAGNVDVTVNQKRLPHGPHLIPLQGPTTCFSYGFRVWGAKS